MAKQSVGSGTTGRIEYIYIIDSLSSTGLGKTNISFNTSGLNGHYVRSAGSATTITFVSQTATGAWTSGGWAEVDATRMAGIYRVDLPDAIFAAGSDKAIVVIKGAANTIPVTLEYQIVGTDPSIQIPSSASIANTVWTNASRTITGGTTDTVSNNVTLSSSTISSIANSTWSFNIIAFGLFGSAAQILTDAYTTAGNVETYVASQTPQDVWTYSGIEGRTITGGIANTVTTLITRTGFAITSNSDKTGYSLSQAFPANFSSLSITGGKVSIVQSDINSILDNIPEVNYSGIAATTWNFLSSAIGNTLSVGYKLITNIDTTVSSRSTLTSKQVIAAIQASVKTVAQVNKDKISKL